MKLLFTLFAVGCLSVIASTRAAAQDSLLAQYVVDLGPEDHFNSAGVRHTTFVGLIAQDRANYHRFGIRHRNDGADPIFHDRAMRAQITQNVLLVEPYYEPYIRNLLASGGAGGSYFVLYVFGRPGQISRIQLVVPG